MSSTVARGLEPSTLLLCIVFSRLETTISTIIPILITLYIYILLGIGPTVAHRESPITAHGADELKTSSVQFLSSSLLLPFLMLLSWRKLYLISKFFFYLDLVIRFYRSFKSIPLLI